MNIFGYFFQKGHFKGSSQKGAHRQKTFVCVCVCVCGGGGGGRANHSLLPPPSAPEGLILPSCDCETEYFKTKHYCNSKNTCFLNEHVAYLRSFTQDVIKNGKNLMVQNSITSNHNPPKTG